MNKSAIDRVINIQAKRMIKISSSWFNKVDSAVSVCEQGRTWIYLHVSCNIYVVLFVHSVFELKSWLSYRRTRLRSLWNCKMVHTKALFGEIPSVNWINLSDCCLVLQLMLEDRFQLFSDPFKGNWSQHPSQSLHIRLNLWRFWQAMWVVP